jgi:hypothetical protein
MWRGKVDTYTETFDKFSVNKAISRPDGKVYTRSFSPSPSNFKFGDAASSFSAAVGFQFINNLHKYKDTVIAEIGLQIWLPKNSESP